MGDLDEAIRADLAQRARETAPEAADRSMVAYADAIRSVLDWARWLEADNKHGRFAHLATSYAQQIRMRIARELSVSPQAPGMQWAVEHPDVRTTAHNSEWSVLYTLSKLPGGRIVVRDAPDQPWRPETACLCGSAKPEVGHLDGCPDTSRVVTPEGTP